ncbi:ATPase associated with various cellular activities AAA_5 [Geobacter metallireducens RCH3]|uniref:ATPase, AAA_5 family n=1 Tax=Geobacter metallireducens (strain ATCC 53774 / DSM 7210 / GS-15) TaxID=269799 RepID=Q39ZG7_GEOMG|nr:MoxR family ATPase [Geobacter metallireducens]ABB30357.1 ATPase, AAA_5 family [Geobacter metallireducens GS-15]EHP85022.1 ATPase associated with various cellular activities AAA_5 [Geobacter metallireducens RCH3]
MSNLPFHQFCGTEGYVASRALQDVVNVAIALERPLLLKGEPGTGKTLLAYHIAKALGMEIILWNVKSTTKARDGLYTYDTVQRLNDARFGDGDVRDIRHYIKLGPLGRAFGSAERVVLLIDEVDKADIEFPNDLLFELDEMRFHVLETDEWVSAAHRPVVIVTSNSEKELPDAFLRRCVFHYIDFPDETQMRAIIDVHFPDLPAELMRSACKVFYGLREVPGLRKRPSTSELLDWIRVLLASGARLPEEETPALQSVPFLGALVKIQEDADILAHHASRSADVRTAGRRFFR